MNNNLENIRIFSEDVIPVYDTDTGEKVVLGRELHEKLKIKTPYHVWFPRMVEYGFVDGTDYFTENKNVHREDGRKMPQVQIDHIIKLDMAKHIAMIQRTPEGMEIRQKLIDLEKNASVNQFAGLSKELQRRIKMAEYHVGCGLFGTIYAGTMMKQRKDGLQLWRSKIPNQQTYRKAWNVIGW